MNAFLRSKSRGSPLIGSRPVAPTYHGPEKLTKEESHRAFLLSTGRDGRGRFTGNTMPAMQAIEQVRSERKAPVVWPKGDAGTGAGQTGAAPHRDPNAGMNQYIRGFARKRKMDDEEYAQLLKDAGRLGG